MRPGWLTAPARTRRTVVGLAFVVAAGCSTPDKAPPKAPSPLSQLPNPSNVRSATADAGSPRTAPAPKPPVQGMPAGLQQTAADAPPQPHQQTPLGPPTVPNNAARMPLTPADAPVTRPGPAGVSAPPVQPAADPGSPSAILAPPPTAVLEPHIPPPTTKVITPPVPGGPALP